MKAIKIIIEKNEDGFWAHSTNAKDLISGYGETISECKKNVLECIEVLKEEDMFPYDENYKLAYTFDIESLLENYKGILTNSGLEKLTGINQRLMYQYANGLKKPRAEQKQKIQDGLHKLAEELLAIEF
jgi:predicted RNase H-like HicB family nuclease